MANSFSSLKDIMSSSENVFSHDGAQQLTSSKRVYMLWYKVNGNFERKHTCGLFLKEPSGKEQYPTLIVYIDKNVVMQDFRTNKGIYLIRLKAQGLILRDIQFVLTKNPRPKYKKEEETKKKEEKMPLPDLSEQEMAYIKDLTKDLDEDMKKTVVKPIISVFKRQKQIHAKDL